MKKPASGIPLSRKQQREKIDEFRERLIDRVAYCKRLKARLKRTFNLFMCAFELCERLDKEVSRMMKEYRRKEVNG